MILWRENASLKQWLHLATTPKNEGFRSGLSPNLTVVMGTGTFIKPEGLPIMCRPEESSNEGTPYDTAYTVPLVMEVIHSVRRAILIWDDLYDRQQWVIKKKKPGANFLAF